MCAAATSPCMAPTCECKGCLLVGPCRLLLATHPAPCAARWLSIPLPLIWSLCCSAPRACLLQSLL